MKSYKKMQKSLGKVTDLHARYEDNLESESPHNSEFTNKETGIVKN
jgi:hypothetical protein